MHDFENEFSSIKPMIMAGKAGEIEMCYKEWLTRLIGLMQSSHDLQSHSATLQI